MKPGRELDALIAEHVMRWEWHEIDGKRYLIPNKSTHIELFELYDKRTLFREVTVHIPAYSTDIAAAWEVLMACRGPDMHGKIEWRGDSKNWYVNILEFEAFSTEAPYAICLAALKAIGVKSEK